MTPDTSDLLETLRSLKPELGARFAVSRISLFGSYSRGEANSTSDVDLLVDFLPEARPTFFSLGRLNDYLEAVLGKRVDLVTRGGLNPRIEPYIREDLIEA